MYIWLCSIECFCGDEKPIGYQLSPDNCTSKCSGDNTPQCGGNWITAIYKTEIPSKNIINDRVSYDKCIINDSASSHISGLSDSYKTRGQTLKYNLCCKAIILIKYVSSYQTNHLIKCSYDKIKQN